MRQTAKLYQSIFGAQTTAQLKQIDKAGAKVRIVHIGVASSTKSEGIIFTARDSSRSYDFAVGSGAGIMFQYWIDQKGDIRTAIELEGNIIFEVTNPSLSLDLTDVIVTLLYDITYNNQKP